MFRSLQKGELGIIYFTAFLYMTFKGYQKADIIFSCYISFIKDYLFYKEFFNYINKF